MSEEKPPEDPEPPVPPIRSIEGGKIGGRPRFGAVTHEIYERMAAAYLAGDRTAKGIVRNLKAQGIPCTAITAKKAIERGWPQHQWPPLRERAQLHDKLHVDAANAADPDRARAARSFLKMREDFLTIASGVRAGLAKSILVLDQNINQAVATQIKPVRQVHFEEHLDAKGRVVRRVPKTITVDVTMAPSIFDMASAWNQIAAALEKVGGGELSQLMAKPPANAAGRQKHTLTDEQLTFIATHGGALPPGVTPEMLGEG